VGDLDNLRDQVRYSSDSKKQSNKWLLIFVIAFPLAGFGAGTLFKGMAAFRDHNRAIKQVAAQLEEGPKTEGRGQKSLSESNAFLAMAKITSDDPYVLASDQVNLYNHVMGTLRSCAKKNRSDKYTRLEESYERNNRAAHVGNRKIKMAKVEAQMKKYEKFDDKIKNGNKTQQVETIVAARSSGMFNQHAEVMMNSMSGMGSYNKAVSDEDCMKISTDVALGKKNIKGIKL